MPVRQCNAFQNFDTNNFSLSEIMSNGKPFSQYQCLKNTDANPSADMSIHVGAICMSEPSQSVMVKIQLNPHLQVMVQQNPLLQKHPVHQALVMDAMVPSV